MMQDETTTYTFPFGQPVRKLVQQDTNPKPFFVLGVYASAVHARWVGTDNKTRIAAMAVASEPRIFWTGDGADDIIRGIRVPDGVGRLEPAPKNMNGPSGRSLDECFLQPLGITRDEAWLCDVVPHSCRNPGQEMAIQREYEPLMEKHGLPRVSLPPVPNPLCGDDRRAAIVSELQKSGATTLILLGDEPIRWFLRFFADRWGRLADFGQTPETYGRRHKVSIAGKEYDVLPLVHPRQASGLGTHSREWRGLHDGWIGHGRCSPKMTRVQPMNQLPEIMSRLYGVVEDLGKMFPGRPFTPDGHMMGSIGEALANYHYGVELHAPSHKGHDGTAGDKSVEVKITQGNRVAIRSEPKHLLVLKLHSDGSFDEIFNGRGSRVWSQIDISKKPSNGQYQISLSRLKSIMETVPDEERLRRKQ